jgi:hypothetical protein
MGCDWLTSCTTPCVQISSSAFLVQWELRIRRFRPVFDCGWGKETSSMPWGFSSLGFHGLYLSSCQALQSITALQVLQTSLYMRFLLYFSPAERRGTNFSELTSTLRTRDAYYNTCCCVSLHPARPKAIVYMYRWSRNKYTAP